MKKVLLLLAGVALSGLTFAQTQVSITVNLNMQNETVDPGGVFMAGGTSFGIPGDNEMTDPDGDGIYSITLMRDQGFTGHYTFTNGACTDWSCKENIAGEPCADPNNFNDRLFTNITADTVINTCFAQCSTDGTCSTPAVPYNVTVQVDMNQQTVDPAGVFLGANWDNWTGGIVMDDTDGDGVYTYTTSLVPGLYEFKFLNGSWDGQEDFDPTTSDSTCTLTTGEFTNRTIEVIDQDITMAVVCFDSCGACVTGGTGIELVNLSAQTRVFHDRSADELVVAMDQAADENFEMTVIDMTGRVVAAETVMSGANMHRVATSSLRSGVYFVRMKSESAYIASKVAISK